METKIALLNNNTVQTVIIGTLEFAQTLGYDQVIDVTNYQGQLQSGMQLVNGVYVMPSEEPTQG
jgi:hypothetical protein